LGGVRCLSHLRDVITNVSALSAPQQAAVGGAKLDEAGNLIADERSLNILSGAVSAALSLARCRA
jgi:hypothetical protein